MASQPDRIGRDISDRARLPLRSSVTRRALQYAEQPRTDRRQRTARAYRAGRLICGYVRVTISDDERLGLTQHERRLVRARFHEPLDDALRAELIQLLRRRGAAARRYADALDAIELVIDDPRHGHQRITGHLQPPQQRHGHLRTIDFGLREPGRPR